MKKYPEFIPILGYVELNKIYVFYDPVLDEIYTADFISLDDDWELLGEL